MHCDHPRLVNWNSCLCSSNLNRTNARNNLHLIKNLNQSIYSNYLKNEILEVCNTINISFIENNNSFNENEWKELYKLSEEIFVEESESLKSKGAGAGLTDND